MSNNDALQELCVYGKNYLIKLLGIEIRLTFSFFDTKMLLVMVTGKAKTNNAYKIMFHVILPFEVFITLCALVKNIFMFGDMVQ